MKKIIVILLMALSLICFTGCKNYNAEIKYTEVLTISAYAEEYVYQNCGYQIISKDIIRVYPFYKSSQVEYKDIYYEYHNVSFGFRVGEKNGKQ